MFWKKKNEKVLEPVDIKTGIELLQKQIRDAKQMLGNTLVKSTDIAAWNESTCSSLTRIYGEQSPNIDTIVEASGQAPVWLFMPDEVSQKYERSCLENKIKLLEGCLIALRRKAKEAERS